MSMRLSAKSILILLLHFISQFNYDIVFLSWISTCFFNQPSDYYIIKKKDQITELGGQRKHFDEKCNNTAPAENT